MSLKFSVNQIFIIVLSGLLVFVSLQLYLHKKQSSEDMFFLENQNNIHGEIQYFYSLLIYQQSLERALIDSSLVVSKFKDGRTYQVALKDNLEERIIIWIPKDACLSCIKKMINISNQLSNMDNQFSSIAFIFEAENLDGFRLDEYFKLPVNSYLVNQPILNTSIISNDILVFFLDTDHIAKSVFIPQVEYETEVKNYFKFLNQFYLKNENYEKD